MFCCSLFLLGDGLRYHNGHDHFLIFIPVNKKKTSQVLMPSFHGLTISSQPPSSSQANEPSPDSCHRQDSFLGSLGQVLQTQFVHALLGDSHDLLYIIHPNAKGVRFFVVHKLEVGTREVIHVMTYLGALRLVAQAQPFIQVFLGCWVLLPKR
jgi:hypothetical protein